jgi:transcriptional regulator with GAF, ATPase, and Fis domain
VENARLYEAATRQRRESEVVAALAAEINRSLDLDRVLQQVAEAATALCKGDVTHIALSEGGTDAFLLRLSIGSRLADSHRLRPARGLGSRVLTTGRPYRSADVREEPNIPPEHRARIETEGMRSVLVVPIHGEDTVEGLIYISRRTVAPFSEHDEAVGRQPTTRPSPSATAGSSPPSGRPRPRPTPPTGPRTTSWRRCRTSCARRSTP